MPLAPDILHSRTVEFSRKDFAVSRLSAKLRVMLISLIAAADENNVIGIGNAIPWSLPDDTQYFRDTTRGCPVIMGRKTHESIGRLLPGRENIVLTRGQADSVLEGAIVAGDMEEALAIAKEKQPGEVFIIGGEKVYEEALPRADRVYMTRVHAQVGEGDAYFPALPAGEWQLQSSKRHEADEKHAFPFTFETYERAS